MDARYYPTLKITLEPSLPKHEAILAAEELAPKIEAWLRAQGYSATVTQPR